MNIASFLSAFSDPAVNVSLIGTLGMALASSIIGVFLFIQKKSLIGETLSHAAFPGILMGSLAAYLLPFEETNLSFYTMTLGGAFFAFLGLKSVQWLEKKRIKIDSALTWTLSSWMGWGVLLASLMQQTHPVQYRKSLLYLYGQLATMTVSQAALYVIFSFLLIILIYLFYPLLKWTYFDLTHAKIGGCKTVLVEKITILFTVITVIFGVRSVGVLLMAGMLVAPAASARCWSTRLSTMLFLSAIIALVSSVIGAFLSLSYSSYTVSLPAGPLILLTASSFCFFSLLFAPSKGVFVRMGKIQLFKIRCQIENCLKQLWKHPDSIVDTPFYIKGILRVKKLISKEGALTPIGIAEAEKIVRLHRLWEVYLVKHLGQAATNVHQTAEELEHLFSPDLEKKLSHLLNHPKHDPHDQPIPPHRREP